MSFGRSFPLMLLPLLAYNVLVLMSPWSTDDGLECAAALETAVHPLTCFLDRAMFFIPTASEMVLEPGGILEPLYLPVTIGDMLLMFALAMLFFEMLKSASTGNDSVINHALSLLVFVGGLIQFLMMPAFSTSVYFLMTLMAVADVLAGFIVSISSARRDIAVG